jgi:hypothetical protein
MQCKAKSRRSGEQCKRAATTGMEVCHMHGGNSRKAGPMHHSFKSGRYSKALDGRTIQEMYERARADPHLLALTEDIALMVAKQQETLERMGQGETRDAWKAVSGFLAKARDAVSRGADGEAESFLGAASEVIDQRLAEERGWVEYAERAEQIRKLVDTERKYQEGLRMYLPLDKANAIMQLWLDAIRRTVPQEHIAKLHEELRRLRSDGMPTIGRLPQGRNVTKLDDE